MNIYVEKQEYIGILIDAQDWLTLKQFEATALIITHTLFL